MDHDAHDLARAEFDRAHRQAWLRGLAAMLGRRPNTLVPYEEARRKVAVDGESDRGVRVVPVERIVGSTDRAADYDRSFRPRRRHTADRWQSVARAAHDGASLPPVRLRKICDDYFVVDGHHRVSVARALGQAFVDAEVVELRVRSTGSLTGPATGARRPVRAAGAPPSMAANRAAIPCGCPA